jgi:hypothetical protein
MRCRWVAHQKKQKYAGKRLHRPNENKMSDGGRERASLGMEVWKSSQKWSVPRSAVRSIAWLGLLRGMLYDLDEPSALKRNKALECAGEDVLS